MSLVCCICFLFLIDSSWTHSHGNKQLICPIRTKYDTKCLYDYIKKELWCDNTNLTAIPKPRDIISYADPASARSLLANDSCIADIKQDDLAAYTRLQHLDASGNLLTKLHPNAFQGCRKHLRTLILSHNFIYKVHKDDFLGLIHLIKLSLSYNKLTSMPRDILSRLDNLEVVLLRGNQLVTPHPEWFVQVSLNIQRTRTPVSKTDIVGENKWRCDCETVRYWHFLKTIQRTPDNSLQLFDIVCATHNGDRMSRLEKEDFCNSNETTQPKKLGHESGNNTIQRLIEKLLHPQLRKRDLTHSDNVVIVRQNKKVKESNPQNPGFGFMWIVTLGSLLFLLAAMVMLVVLGRKCNIL